MDLGEQELQGQGIDDMLRAVSTLLAMLVVVAGMHWERASWALARAHVKPKGNKTRQLEHEQTTLTAEVEHGGMLV